MKYIELFAGVGGFRLGIERATDAGCVFANEWDKYAAQTYNKNFGGEIDTRDITTISTDEIPNHDLLVGGFPCQAFSVAGKRAGFNDTRGTMFFEIARILADKKPQHLLLENVKGLLSHDSGRTFQTILKVLADLGYGVEWQVLNSKDFGVPQNRERVFIVGHLGGIGGRQVFPITRAAQATDITILAHHKSYRRNSQVFDPQGQTEALSTSQGGGREHFTIKDMRIRRLTPTECERLQGFPDGWTEGVSDTQRYKQMGNAVTVNVIKAIIERLYI